jgi:hypothetical protein
MRCRLGSVLLLTLTLAVIACGSDADELPEAAEAGQDAGADDMAGMEGMPGMRGATSARNMGSEMTAHMDQMQGTNGDSLMQMVPVHRQMLGNLISQMNREMAGMNMAADASWTALTDSLRDDLVRIPSMAATEIRAFMPEHRGRVDRLISTHGAMMGGM